MKRSGRCEERMGRQQGRSIARATRGLRRPSLDARSLAQPCYLPQETHRPQREKRRKGSMQGRAVSRARRAPTMKQWSLDARSSRQSCPLPKDQAGHLEE